MAELIPTVAAAGSGAVSGGTIGAQIGTAIAPGIGTTIGGVLGAIVGALGGVATVPASTQPGMDYSVGAKPNRGAGDTEYVAAVKADIGRAYDSLQAAARKVNPNDQATLNALSYLYGQYVSAWGDLNNPARNSPTVTSLKSQISSVVNEINSSYSYTQAVPASTQDASAASTQGATQALVTVPAADTYSLSPITGNKITSNPITDNLPLLIGGIIVIAVILILKKKGK